MNNERVIKLDEYEFGAILSLINEKRNSLIEQEKNVEFITEILEKIIKSPSKKKLNIKKERKKCER